MVNGAPSEFPESTQCRGKFTKITISLNSTKTKISYETMKNFKETYHRL